MHAKEKKVLLVYLVENQAEESYKIPQILGNIHYKVQFIQYNFKKHEEIKQKFDFILICIIT